MKITYPLAGAVSLGLVFGFTQTSSSASDSNAPIKLAGVWKLNKELSDNPRAKMMEAMRERGGAGGGRGMGGQGGGGRGGAGGMGGGGGRGGGGGGRGGGGMAGGGAGGRGGGGAGGGMERGERGGPGGMGGGGMMGGEPPLDGAPDGDRPEGQGPRGQGASGQRPEGPPPDQAGGGRPGGRGPRGGMGPIPSPQFTIEQEGDNLAFRTENNLRLLHSDGQKRKKEGEAGPFEVVTKFAKGSLLIESKSEMGGKRKETYTLLPDGKLQIDFDLEGAGRMPSLKFKLVYEAAPAAQF